MATERAVRPKHVKDGFSTRRVFIFAAIGSAVGLGNIWRFPYVAYEGGGGAFLIPYLVALVLAGIPLLYFLYAVGHRNRGSAPLSLRRFSKGAEWIGWWMVLVAVVIGVYYAAIIAWAIKYTFLSFNLGWGDDPEAYLNGDFLQVAESAGPTMDYVPQVLLLMIVVWVVTIGVLGLGVQNGIGRTAVIFIPVLLIAFSLLVIYSLTLDGAGSGLNAFFSPDWAALKDSSVWISAVGQIFFSLSIGFGIMITYASYVKPRTDMTGSGAVVAFANSGFELLAGIGVFATLGFIAQSTGQAVGDVVASGIGLAFVAFPTIINEAPGGALIGVLFFGSLVLAGLTSLISIVEVIIGAVRDKAGISRQAATYIVGIPMAVVSIGVFSTTGGLYVLDTMDAFVNSFGIVGASLIVMLALSWVFRKLPTLATHMNVHGSIKLLGWWKALVAVVIPVALAVMLFQEFQNKIETPYGDYPASLVNTFGWGMAAALPIIAIILSFLPWRGVTDVEDPGDLYAEHALADGGEQA